MHAVIRNYSGKGAKELFDVLERRKGDVEDLIRAVDGFVSYALIRTADGGVTMTVCRDKAGTDASLKVAREWIAANAASVKASPPAITEGPVVIHAS